MERCLKDRFEAAFFNLLKNLVEFCPAGLKKIEIHLIPRLSGPETYSSTRKNVWNFCPTVTKIMRAAEVQSFCQKKRQLSWQVKLFYCYDV